MVNRKSIFVFSMYNIVYAVFDMTSLHLVGMEERARKFRFETLENIIFPDKLLWRHRFFTSLFLLWRFQTVEGNNLFFSLLVNNNNSNNLYSFPRNYTA